MPTLRATTRSLLALILLATTIGVATAPVASAGPQAGSGAPSAQRGSGAVLPAISTTTRDLSGVPGDTMAELRREHAAPRPSVTEGGDAWIGRSRADTPAPRAQVETTPDLSSFTGRNKVWIPALGIRRSVSSFACSSTAYPGDRVYRWGCAGSNNIYLFGHAHSVFKPLHDAYVRGRLEKGMQVHYADANGRVSTYKVAWWKVTTPDKGEFAYASQSRPSMTLQTCVGAKSQYRLVVRLVKAG